MQQYDHTETHLPRRRFNQKQHLPSLRPVLLEIPDLFYFLTFPRLKLIRLLTEDDSYTPHPPVATHCFQLITVASEWHLRLHV